MESASCSSGSREHVNAEGILRAFGQAGLRNTRPRRVIARCLAEHAASEKDFATEELWQQLQPSNPHLGRATLFRAVDVLADLGVLDRIELGDGTRRYRVCGTAHHHHLICTCCHRIDEIEICLPETQLAGAAAQAGFAVDRHVLEVYGRCAECRETHDQHRPVLD
jgi:Fur family ferric uptake transcriptional regulator